jgi:S1-C subfamily serine protease
MEVVSQPDKQIRLSLTWVVLLVLMMIGLGMLGGFVVQSLFPPTAPLNTPAERLLTTVQEVTISPNTAVSQVLDRAQRAVVLMGTTTELRPAEATGLIVTNDGLLVTTARLASTPYAFDERGKAIALQAIGRDELFGLSYYRITEGVFPSLEMRAEDIAVGHELLLVSRSRTTGQPRVSEFRVHEYTLPTEDSAGGIHRLLHGTASTDAASIGSPLLDEEGRVAAIIIQSTTGTALPVMQLRESITRVVSDKREAVPLKDLGLTVRYVFIPAEQGPLRFGAEVTSVVPGSVADRAGVKTRDVIVEAGTSGLPWQGAALSAFSGKLPLAIKVVRASGEETITLQP